MSFPKNLHALTGFINGAGGSSWLTASPMQQTNPFNFYNIDASASQSSSRAATTTVQDIDMADLFAQAMCVEGEACVSSKTVVVGDAATAALDTAEPPRSSSIIDFGAIAFDDVSMFYCDDVRPSSAAGAALGLDSPQASFDLGGLFKGGVNNSSTSSLVSQPCAKRRRSNTITDASTGNPTAKIQTPARTTTKSGNPTPKAVRIKEEAVVHTHEHPESKEGIDVNDRLVCSLVLSGGRPGDPVRYCGEVIYGESTLSAESKAAIHIRKNVDGGCHQNLAPFLDVKSDNSSGGGKVGTAAQHTLGYVKTVKELKGFVASNVDPSITPEELERHQRVVLLARRQHSNLRASGAARRKSKQCQEDNDELKHKLGAALKQVETLQRENQQLRAMVQGGGRSVHIAL